MRFFRVWGCAAAAAWVVGMAAEATAGDAAGSSGRTVLLSDALNTLLDQQGRWAYTETRTGVDPRGRPIGESVTRVDPSVTYGEQYKPIKIRGKDPTEKQLKQAAERGEREAKRRLDQEQKASALGPIEEKPKTNRADEVQMRVNGQKVRPQIDQATIAAEDESSVTFEVPMHPEAAANRMLDKFELTARVNKNTRQFERVIIRQREAVRVKLIAKVSGVLLTIDFSTPDPRYPAVATTFSAEGNLALLFGKNQAMHSESVRTEFRHVTPYDEKFQVKTGEVRTIEF